MSDAGPCAEDAKRLEECILDLERKFAREKSGFVKKKLQEKIKCMKEAYMGTRSQADLVPIQKKTMKVGVSPQLKANNAKVVIDGRENEHLSPPACVEATIRNCRNITVDHFVCTNSVFLERLQDCTVHSTAQQIRVTECTGITLVCFSATGVFLQDSTAILVREHKDANKSGVNRFSNVCDFSDPCGASNYSVHRQDE